MASVRCGHAVGWLGGVRCDWLRGVRCGWLGGVRCDWLGGVRCGWLGGVWCDWLGGVWCDWLGGVRCGWLGGVRCDWLGGVRCGWLGGVWCDWLGGVWCDWLGGVWCDWLGGVRCGLAAGWLSGVRCGWLGGVRCGHAVGRLGVGCLTSQQNAGVSQGRICLHICTATDAKQSIPSTDRMAPSAWQGSRCRMRQFFKSRARPVCLFVSCLKFQQHAGVSQEQICLDKFTCCHAEIEVRDHTFYLTQSQYIEH